MGRTKKILVDREVLNKLSTIVIPTHIFRGSTLGVLESMVTYLKEEEKMSYHHIGIILGRDERNMWTVYNRARKKNAK